LLLKKNNKLSDFPELLSLNITLQEPLWHPEGNVWVHTLMVIDVAAELRHNFEIEAEAIDFMLGSLCHDLGKPYTTSFDNGSLRCIMHDSMGLAPTFSLLSKIGLLKHYDSVANYILEHLKPIHLFSSKSNVSDLAIKKLARRIDIEKLVLLCTSDHFGRTDLEAEQRIFPDGVWLIDRYYRILNRDNRH